MSKIQFEIVETADYDKFCKECQQKLDDGWEFHGGLIAFPNHNNEQKHEPVLFIQAFIKKESTMGMKRHTPITRE